MSEKTIAEEILRGAIDDLNMQIDEKVEYSDDLILNGDGSRIDSMDRAVIIMFIETEIEERFHHSVSLLEDEQFRDSGDNKNPLRTVGSLKEWLSHRLEELN